MISLYLWRGQNKVSNDYTMKIPQSVLFLFVHAFGRNRCRLSAVQIPPNSADAPDDMTYLNDWEAMERASVRNAHNVFLSTSKSLPIASVVCCVCSLHKWKIERLIFINILFHFSVYSILIHNTSWLIFLQLWVKYEGALASVVPLFLWQFNVIYLYFNSLFRSYLAATTLLQTMMS